MILESSITAGFGFALSAWFAVEWRERARERGRLRSRLRPFEVKRTTKPLEWKQLSAFPDFLDLLALGLNAGLSIDAAWKRAAALLPAGSLSDDLKEISNAIDWGRPREDVLRGAAARWKDPSATMTLLLLSQAMRRGGGIQDVLVEQARVLRQRRFTQMEKAAQTAGVRLLFPIFIFILPAVFLVLLAPLWIRLSSGGQFDLFF